jgi:hypothetical protein
MRLEQALGGSGIIALFSAVSFLGFRLLHVLNKQMDRDDVLRNMNERCERRLSIIVGVAHKHGWVFPPEFWEDENDHAKSA